ncbi:DJ-1/PfpI family protein [Catenuloplanes indicus]|uniref:Intracellular protease/amidase n=1 Tax=Catenuloplanes indicus TaxID=137267 RepID=A0AAE3W1E3_9ACTN|nr:DJ-1/PfpI family protein [Catenuloplanes indicus]MDQ0367556.1 putative intracellular protease/amidase [Catenuloplanes indicus]
MRIAVALFPRVTALDAIGPYETLQRLPDTTVTFVGHRRGEIRTDNGELGLTVDKTFDEVTDPDVVIIPGGVGIIDLLHDEAALDWVRTTHATSRFTTSVCSGSLLLAAAGLLPGMLATTHYTLMEKLAGLGAIPTDERVVMHLEQRIITSAGVSSGIDMALHLAELLTDTVTAQAMQLMVEYDPQPPFDAGSTRKAGTAVQERAAELFKLKD